MSYKYIFLKIFPRDNIGKLLGFFSKRFGALEHSNQFKILGAS
jgi:hypothetical protein